MKNLLLVGGLLFFATTASAAYHHADNTDSDVVLDVYPELAGTKLDSCALCHTGGEYVKSSGKTVKLGSCQWCHLEYGYDESGNIDDTLNGYGAAYKAQGRNADALTDIADLDSDSDGYNNADEIAALRYPGSANDDPSKVTAPYQVISIDDMENMDFHSQIMLMNTHKSGDFYTEYGGVTIADILDYSGILPEATGITVYAPDGWSQYHPLEEDSDASMYHVYGKYPEAPFYYAREADKEVDADIGWCDYSAQALEELKESWVTHNEDGVGEIIENENGLRMLLAFTRDGNYLETGVLTEDNKLDGEGPFRVVTPQKTVGPPDQSTTSDYTEVIWPFSEENDHNAGFASRSATMIRVEPLPEGTTDIDILEAGWNYVDAGKIVVYGAIDPFYTVLEKMINLKKLVRSMGYKDFKRCLLKRRMLLTIHLAERFLKKGKNRAFTHQLETLSRRVDGCSTGSGPDRNDWVTNCENQQAAYWAIHEMNVLMGAGF